MIADNAGDTHQNFADCTDDHQWIHVNEDMAKNGPFGTTIAHGYLTLSLLPSLSPKDSVVPEGIKMAINYGMNKVRFLTPVKVGSKIRNTSVLKEVTDKGGGRILMCMENTVEIARRCTRRSACTPWRPLGA